VAPRGIDAEKVTVDETMPDAVLAHFALTAATTSGGSSIASPPDGTDPLQAIPEYCDG
jgi:hypothetical protein